MATSDNTISEEGPTALSSPSTKRSFRFWGIFAALCLLSFISALDVAIITTALPSIVADIGGATQYIWIANSFTVSSSVLQPLWGQLANILGRRIPFIAATALFTLGSGIGGGAKSPAMLISGRAIQGVGAGGVYLLLSIVCCDLVPLRERGKYLGLMNAWAGVAAALGPVVGGAIAQTNWRWIFYLNVRTRHLVPLLPFRPNTHQIPICGVALGMLFLFMHMKTGTANKAQPAKLSSKWARVKELDWLGNLIFTPSMISLLLGLIMGGVQYPWSSWHVVVPLVLGCVGWLAFHIQQHFATNPSIPERIFGNRTSATAFLLTFLSSVLVQAQSYFLPLYFQAARGTTILHSGTNFLPFAIGTLTFAATAGVLLSKFGAYRPLHAAAFALSTIGFGLFTLLSGSTAKGAWVVFQLIASAGSGMILSTLLPAILAGLPESDVASASAAFAFTKTFGYTWGVTIASIIFNSVFDANLSVISSPTLQNTLRGGGAYAFASQMHTLRRTQTIEIWKELVFVYCKSLRAIWWVGLGISIVGFFAVGLERGLELRNTLETKYGIDDGNTLNRSSKEGRELNENAVEESKNTGNARGTDSH
ncbi:hypothetical protein G7Y89_g4885 [Cudoniella acicularis]|uniref:Major facilitator superfamily (MFS) profile domain-containing protein n=1 Tax=Cudoniella acicularis TaxID=354080 RepID=A0A8H4W4I7_9HELO|nr:hypothetical protein G7Y89_g4885 [Cudoniella acicularis]